MNHNRLMRLLCAGMMLAASVCIPQSVPLKAEAAYDEILTYGDFDYKDLYGNIYLISYHGTKKNVEIPNTIDGKKVIYFYPSTFSGNTEIESITIPSNIRNIEGGSFFGCTSLKQFICHNKEYSFSNGFLYHIYREENVHQSTTVRNTMVKQPDGSKITKTYKAEYDVHKAVLFYTKDSAYVTVPEGVDDIAPYAFAGRDKMTHIVLPAGIKRIGEKAFMGCSNLRGMSMTSNDGSAYEFNIPFGTVVIEDSAFVGCYEIRNINFPTTLEAIGKHAFATGMNLKSVYIPQSVKLIGDYAFGATAAENGNCVVHCECVILVSDAETDENGDLSAAAEYAYSCRENFSETESFNGGDTNEDGSYTVTVRNTFGTEQYTVSEPPVTHNPDDDYDHTYIYSACVPVTCTTSGALAGICTCGHTFYREFPVLGHAFTEPVTVEPTCTEDGYSGMKCIRCDTVYERNNALISPLGNAIPDKERIPALGHSYGAPTYEWSEDNSACKATAVCTHDDSHTKTENAAVTSKTENGYIVYTASFTDATFAAQTVRVKTNTPEPVTEQKNGDLNGDGETNLKDVVTLRRYIAGGWDMTVDPAVVDINKDGAVNLKDVVLLRRYIAGGWNVDLNATP